MTCLSHTYLSIILGSSGSNSGKTHSSWSHKLPQNHLIAIGWRKSQDCVLARPGKRQHLEIIMINFSCFLQKRGHLTFRPTLQVVNPAAARSCPSLNSEDAELREFPLHYLIKGYTPRQERWREIRSTWRKCLYKNYFGEAI